MNTMKNDNFVDGLGPETLALDAGLVIDPRTKAIQPNISMSVNNLVYPDEGAFSAAGIDDLTKLPFMYARWSNPTVQELETRLAGLEGAEQAMCTASGVSAIAAVFLGILKAGDHLIISDVCYAGAAELARSILPDFGIEVTCVNLSKQEELRMAMRENTRLVYCESPCNPLIRFTDLQAVSDIAHEGGALVSVDSTLSTPVACRPLTLGCDLVIHSLTKFINGHGDAMGGVLAGNASLVARIRARSGVYLGATLSAMNAWLILRGLDTLYPRMKTMSESATRIAAFLEAHPKVKRVRHPSLASHPQADLIKKQADMPGALIAFETEDLQDTARKFADRLKVIHNAFSLGHQRSLITLLETDVMMESTYRLTGEQLDDYRFYAGDGVFRLSVGLERTEDLIRDLEHGLAN